jgi:hypothetical protein
MNRLSLAAKFSLGDEVMHRGKREEAQTGIVTGIVTRPTGVQILVTWPDREESAHFEMELEEV